MKKNRNSLKSKVYNRIFVVPPFSPSVLTQNYPADFAMLCPDGVGLSQEEVLALCRRYQEVFVHASFLESVSRPLPDNCFPLSDIVLEEQDDAASLTLAVEEHSSLWQWLQANGSVDAAKISIVTTRAAQTATAPIFLLPGPSALNAMRPKYFSLTGELDLAGKQATLGQHGAKRLVACLGMYGDRLGDTPLTEIDDWAELVRDAAEAAGWEAVFVTAPGGPDYPGFRRDDASLTVLREVLADAQVLVTACSRAAHVAVALGRSPILLPLSPCIPPLFRDADASWALPMPQNADALAAVLREIEAGAALPGDRDAYRCAHSGRRDPEQSVPGLLQAFEKAAALRLTGLPSLPEYKAVAKQLPLSIFIFGANPRGTYSGGRYFAWILAESLALVGHNVTFVTNVEPIFSRDFELSPAHHKLKIIISSTYKIRNVHSAADCVIIVPSMFGSHYFYENAVSFAKQNRAHVCLLNFETPNWYNALSPVPRDPMAWADWARTVMHCSMVISMLQVTSNYSRQYYDLFNTDCQHIIAPPPVNDMAADIVPPTPREDRVVAIIRFDLAEHKGVNQLFELIDEPMRGHTLALLVGQEKRPEEFVRQLEAKAAACGVRLEFLDRLSDQEKFKQLARAKLLLFMSQFEGYGYPPLEALYCGTPCLAFDLEPLRETCGDLLHYAPPGDWAAFKARLAKLLATPFNREKEGAFDADSIRMATFGEKLGRELQKMCAAPPSTEVWGRGMPSYQAFCAAYRHRLLAGDKPLPMPAKWLTVLDASLHDGCVLSVSAIVAPAKVTVSLTVNGVEVSRRNPGTMSADIQGQALLARCILPPAALVEPPETCILTIINEKGVSFTTRLQLRAGEGRSPAALFIESQQFDPYTNMLRLKGWVLGGDAGFCLRVSQQGRDMGYALLNLPRPDIARQYGLGQRQYGWSFAGTLEATYRDTAASVAVEMLDGDRLLARRSLCVQHPEQPVLEWPGLDEPQRDGPVVAVVTHVPFLPVRQGNHIVIDQLLTWLRGQGYRVFLVLQINPRHVTQRQEDYQRVADRVFVVNPDVKTPGTVPLNKGDLTHINTKRCLHDIASRHELHAVVAEYVHLAACLEALPASALGIVQTHDALHRAQAFKAKGIAIAPPFRDCTAAEEKRLLRCAKVVVAIQDRERKIFADLAPERQVITVGVSRDSFGEPLPPSPEHSRSVFIAASGNPLNVEGLRQFLEHSWPTVLSLVPQARLRLAGNVGQAGDFSAENVDCLGLVDYLDAEYENAAVCINPVSMGTGLKIKSVETLARGRALVSTSVGVEGICTYGRRAFVVADDWRQFAYAVANLLRDVAYRHATEREAVTYARLYLNQDFVYRQLAETLARNARTVGRQRHGSLPLRVI
jgi:glycosyltransferase involved in cell wall biosynthesis